jgi:hypothetical protein
MKTQRSCWCVRDCNPTTLIVPPPSPASDTISTKQHRAALSNEADANQRRHLVSQEPDQVGEVRNGGPVQDEAPHWFVVDLPEIKARTRISATARAPDRIECEAPSYFVHIQRQRAHGRSHHSLHGGMQHQQNASEDAQKKQREQRDEPRCD